MKDISNRQKAFKFDWYYASQHPNSVTQHTRSRFQPQPPRHS